MRAIGEGVRMLDRSREFLVLAECLNFVKAAERLHMSQPSLTRHIARLECELGFKLFNRNPMALTPAGAHYFDAVRGVIDQFDAVVEQGRRIAAENGTGPTVSMVVSSNNRSAAVMFEAMATLHDRHPYEPAAHLLPDSHMAVAASVLSGKADVGIVFREPADLPEGYVCELLLDLPLSILVHKDNPLSQRASLTLEDLRGCYLVCPSNPHLQTTFEGAVDTFRSAGIEPKYRIRDICEFDQISASIRIDEMLFKTGGMFVPNSVPFLVEMRFDPPLTYRSYLLHGEHPDNPCVSELVAICREIAARRNA